MTKITFKDLPDTTTPLSASNLNTMQDNIEDAIDNIEITLDSAVSTSSTNGVENQAITNYVDGIAATIPEVETTQTLSATNTYSCNYINSIIESGSNANGSYVKYADGTMICYGSKSGALSRADWWSFCDRTSDSIITTFAQAFTSAPNITTTATSTSTSNGMITCVITEKTASTFKTFPLVVKGSTASIYDFEYIAIGKWK